MDGFIIDVKQASGSGFIARRLPQHVGQDLPLYGGNLPLHDFLEGKVSLRRVVGVLIAFQARKHRLTENDKL
jgi:hypothetical protein